MLPIVVVVVTVGSLEVMCRAHRLILAKNAEPGIKKNTSFFYKYAHNNDYNMGGGIIHMTEMTAYVLLALEIWGFY